MKKFNIVFYVRCAIILFFNRMFFWALLLILKMYLFQTR